jgi:hypothetical protein
MAGEKNIAAHSGKQMFIKVFKAHAPRPPLSSPKGEEIAKIVAKNVANKLKINIKILFFITDPHPPPPALL